MPIKGLKMAEFGTKNYFFRQNTLNKLIFSEKYVVWDFRKVKLAIFVRNGSNYWSETKYISQSG